MKNSQKEAVQPAYPFMWDQSHNPKFGIEVGMTKREYFAATAMQGLIVHADHCEQSGVENIVSLSIDFADALLQQLHPEETNPVKL